MSGPAPLPAQILKNRGSTLAKAALELEGQIPDIHESQLPVANTEGGERFVNDIIPLMTDLGILAKTDEMGLNLLLEVFESYQGVRAIWLVATPYTADWKDAYTVMNQERATFIKMLKEFGLTPSSRTRVKGRDTGKPPHGNSLQAKRDKYG